MAKGQSDEDWGKPDESGGLPSSVTMTVRKAKYGYDDGYQKGEALLLKFIEVDVEEIDNPQEDFEPWWPMGKGWEPKDGGKTAVHESRSTPHVTSALGQVYKAIFGTKGEAGMEHEGVGLAKLLREHSGATTPMDASMWTATRWSFERRELPLSEDFRKQAMEKGRMPSTLIPVEFLGFADEKKGKKATSFDAEAFLEGIDAGVRKELRKAARKADSDDEFGDLAAEVEGLESDDETKAAVLGHLGEIREALTAG